MSQEVTLIKKQSIDLHSDEIPRFPDNFNQFPESYIIPENNTVTFRKENEEE